MKLFGYGLKLMDAFLLFIPIALALELSHAPGWAVFISSLLAIIPLAGRMGEATEELTKYLGPNAGGFLNATFGNATELIIALIAIDKGLFELVKASITGSIVGNLLFVLGLAILLGGHKIKEQKFNTKAAGVNSSMMLIAVISMIIPSAFFIFSKTPASELAFQTEEISLLVSVILIICYLLSLYFSFRTHKYLFHTSEHSEEAGKPALSRNAAIALLILCTIGVAVMAELFIGAIESFLAKPIAYNILGFAGTLAIHELFLGAVVVAVIGNATEHISAVLAAIKDNMDLAISITAGSSIQIALFVAPLLVIISFLMGKPMDLVFTLFEILAVFASVIIVNEISSDGECNWFEGVQLLAMYLLVAVLFFFAV